jgi:hypothetical protein
LIIEKPITDYSGKNKPHCTHYHLFWLRHAGHRPLPGNDLDLKVVIDTVGPRSFCDSGFGITAIQLEARGDISAKVLAKTISLHKIVSPIRLHFPRSSEKLSKA